MIEFKPHLYQNLIQFIVISIGVMLLSTVTPSYGKQDSSLIPSELKDADVCSGATFYQGTKKRFRNSAYFLPFVTEAKRRGLNCGVTMSSLVTKTLDEDPVYLRSVITKLREELFAEKEKIEELNTLLSLSKSQFAELQDTLNKSKEDIYKPMGSNDNLFVALYFLLHLFIIFFFFSFLIIERSRSKLLIENDGLDFEGTSYNAVVSSGIGKIPYAIFRFIFRPLILLSLFALIGWSGYLMKWMVMLPALGIILLTISFNSPFLRILFPILILGGVTDLLLRFL